jgi:four helix bundle protein
MSNEQRRKIKNFTDLNAWEEAHSLYVATHVATKKFPKDELFGLTSQIRRASLSVSSNIAYKLHFYIMARGSLFETQNQLIASKDVNLLNDLGFNKLFKQSQTTQRILIGLINATRERQK